MLRGLIKISPKHAAAKKISIVTFCANLGAKLSDRLTADGVVMGIGLGGAVISYFSADAFCEKKDEEVKQIIASIREHEIYPKIYRLANGNIEARKALGYRIDPRMWSAWEYVKMNVRRLYDKYQQTDVTSSVFTPLVRKFSLPVQGSKQPGVLQVWASRQKAEDAWELERMELLFSPRDILRPNINFNAMREEERQESGSADDDLESRMMPTDVLFTHDFDPLLCYSEVEPDSTIVIWIDSGIPPRAQLEDPSVELSSLPNMDDPWKIQLDDFEEPAVDYINEE